MSLLSYKVTIMGPMVICILGGGGHYSAYHRCCVEIRLEWAEGKIRGVFQYSQVKVCGLGNRMVVMEKEEK